MEDGCGRLFPCLSETLKQTREVRKTLASEMFIDVNTIAATEEALKQILKDELTAYKFVVTDKGAAKYITISAEKAYELATDIGDDGDYVRVADFINPPKEIDEGESENKADVGTAEFDEISKPKHYCFSNYQPKDVIREWDLNFNLGNAIKYIARAGKKESAIKDLKKARQYIEFEIDYLTKNNMPFR